MSVLVVEGRTCAGQVAEIAPAGAARSLSPRQVREPVLCGTRATAPESGYFPPILSRHGRDAPLGENISGPFIHSIGRRPQNQEAKE